MYQPKHFHLDEFRCSCCGALPAGGMDENLLEVLDKIRDAIGAPLYVTSGYRCERCNDECGGVPNSQHLYGRAADVYADGDITPLQIAALAEKAGADGIGIYDDFCHVDTRGSFARWCEW